MSTAIRHIRTVTATSASGERLLIYSIAPVFGGVLGTVYLESDAGPVNRVARGVYTLPELDNLEVRSDDPNAP